MAALLCFKSCEDHSLLKGYNGSLWKTVTGLGPIIKASLIIYCFIAMVLKIGQSYSERRQGFKITLVWCDGERNSGDFKQIQPIHNEIIMSIAYDFNLRTKYWNSHASEYQLSKTTTSYLSENLIRSTVGICQCSRFSLSKRILREHFSKSTYDILT